MKVGLISIQIMLCVVAGCSAARASDGGQNKYLSVPVLYMTDRAASAKHFGAQRKIETGTAIYRLNLGTLVYSVRNSLDKQLLDKQKQLDWSGSEKKLPLAIKPIEGSGTDEAFHQFGKAVTEAALKTSSKEVFVIIHGYNTTFAEAAESAADLAYNVESPVVVFDWPSKGKLGQYDVDAGNNEWSQEHFDRLLEELKAVKDQSGIKFNLLAHSMGNRLAIRSAPVLAGQHQFDQMYLVDSDFDAETFVHYLIRYARNNQKAAEKSSTGSDKPAQTKIRILFSHHDRALPFAQLLFGGYTRLGQAADQMLSTVFNPLSVTELVHLKNDQQADEVSTTEVADWAVKFEWIDFTVLDHGVIGHTIPFNLIANLSSNDTPGDGLKLIDSENAAPNKLSKVFLGLFHEKKHVSSRLGICKRVAFNKANDQKLSGANALK